MEQNRPIDLLGIGLSVIDHTVLLERYPERNQKTVAIDACISAGGPVTNAVCLASKVGLKTSLISTIGIDPEGDLLITELDRRGVDTSCFIRDSSVRTLRSMIWVDQNSGDRTVVLIDKNSRNLKADEILPTLISNSRSILLDGRGYDATMRALLTARKTGTISILDAGSHRDGIEEIIRNVDYLICSQSFAIQLTCESSPESMLSSLLSRSARTVITLGKHGAIGSEGNEIVRVRAFPVQVIDSTGAGDVYHGAFAAGLLGQFGSLEFRDCMRIASIAGGLSCQGLGGQGYLPSREQIMDCFQKNLV